MIAGLVNLTVTIIQAKKTPKLEKVLGVTDQTHQEDSMFVGIQTKRDVPVKPQVNAVGKHDGKTITALG